MHDAYRQSESYIEPGDATRAAYDRLLSSVFDRFDDAPVGRADRVWVLRRHSELIATPHTATYLIAVIRRLFSFRVEIGLMTTNPPSRVRPLRAGPRRRVWTDAEVLALTGPAAADVALPVLLSLSTAQRQAGVLRMPWNAYDGQTIRVRQGKAGQARPVLVVPLHPALAAALTSRTRSAAVIRTMPSGRPRTTDWFRPRFADVRNSLGLPADLHVRGLRHSAASKLAEAGASDARIQTMTGHQTRAMVARHAAGARREQLAQACLARLPIQRSQNTECVRTRLDTMTSV